jgi:transcriptional regulator with XRE-family HTH domain
VDDGHGVAAIRHVREHIDLSEGTLHPVLRSIVLNTRYPPKIAEPPGLRVSGSYAAPATIRGMEDRTIGRVVRALRHRLGWRQQDLGSRAGVSQGFVSLVERGRIGNLTVDRSRSVCGCLDARLVITVQWRGGDLDRLLDEGHATLVGRISALLEGLGWETGTEITFSEFGERGSIDVLAWHPATRTLLVVEDKSELASIEETLRTHDVKVRLAPKIAVERGGWKPAAVGRLLVLPDLSTPRRRVARHDAVLVPVYAWRRAACRAWLSAGGAGSALLFLSPTTEGRTGRRPVSRKRIHRRPEARSRVQVRPPVVNDVPPLKVGVQYDGRS